MPDRLLLFHQSPNSVPQASDRSFISTSTVWVAASALVLFHLSIRTSSLHRSLHSFSGQSDPIFIQYSPYDSDSHPVPRPFAPRNLHGPGSAHQDSDTSSLQFPPTHRSSTASKLSRSRSDSINSESHLALIDPIATNPPTCHGDRP